jgi:hypothetical protein
MTGTWRKSTFSGTGANECVECAILGRTHAVRDSKNPGGPTLFLAGSAWRGLIFTARGAAPR